jgi:hypothetical protein
MDNPQIHSPYIHFFFFFSFFLEIGGQDEDEGDLPR